MPPFASCFLRRPVLFGHPIWCYIDSGSIVADAAVNEDFLRAADILDGEKETLGRRMTTEMGKSFRAGVDEAIKCASACRYFADEVVETTASCSYDHLWGNGCWEVTTRVCSAVKST